MGKRRRKDGVQGLAPQKAAATTADPPSLASLCSSFSIPPAVRWGPRLRGSSDL